jgi:deoxyribonuclease (pyrimidine dimer)
MTRINLVPVTELMDQHLMAEYRELPMVHASLRRSAVSKRGLRFDQYPKTYTLNKGHVSFFYDKGWFLLQRYTDLIAELKLRGFNINPEDREFSWQPFHEYFCWGSIYAPTEAEIALSRERIELRISENPLWYRKTSYARTTE